MKRRKWNLMNIKQYMCQLSREIKFNITKFHTTHNKKNILMNINHLEKEKKLYFLSIKNKIHLHIIFWTIVNIIQRFWVLHNEYRQ